MLRFIVTQILYYTFIHKNVAFKGFLHEYRPSRLESCNSHVLMFLFYTSHSTSSLSIFNMVEINAPI